MLILKSLVVAGASLAVAVTTGCGRQEGAKDSAPAADTAVDTASEASTLPTPFTAEQIRDEWVVGFEVVMRRNGPEGEFLERWRVVDADLETVSIEGVVVDALGEPIGEPLVGRSGWTELRDHAAFPAERGIRIRDHRSTALGSFDGWLYVIQDEDGEGATRYFFADALPGAPVQVEAVVGEHSETVLEQIERFRPEASDRA